MLELRNLTSDSVEVVELDDDGRVVDHYVQPIADEDELVELERILKS